jgi:FMN phosphatase YigB (HAD superfamily)
MYVMKLYNLPNIPKLLVFDIDLTLYDSSAYQMAQRHALIERLSLHLGVSAQETAKRLRAIRDDFSRRNNGRQLSMGNAFRRLGVNIATSIEWREALYEPEHYLRLDRELNVALTQLAATFRLVAVTNNPTSIGERTLSALGVRQHFDPVLGLDQFGESKPTIAPFRMVSAHHGVPLTEMISIGDRMSVDIETPVQHGMGGILVEDVRDVYRLPQVLLHRLS